MKKILTILISLMVFAWVADAQISIKKSDIDNPEQVATLSPAWSWLYKMNDAYFVVMKSSNQFDDWYWLKIGKTKEECLESLTSLQDLCKTITETDRFEIDNGLGQTFSVTQYKMMGVGGIQFKDQSHAGFGYLIPGNFNKAIKWIQTKVE